MPVPASCSADATPWRAPSQSAASRITPLPRETAAAPPSGEDDGQAWLTTLDSAAGPVTAVLPPGQLDDEALTWPRELSRYGGDEAAWPG